MSEPIVVPPGGGEIIGDAPDRRVEILSDHDALHATWSRFAAGRDGADLHVHYEHTDFFYVLDGELTLRLGVEGEAVVVAAGTLARVPPGVVHGFRNASDAEVRYLNLHAPGIEFANFMRALRDGRTPPASYDQHPPPADGGRPTTEAVVGGQESLGEELGLRATLLADVGAVRIAEVLCESGSEVAADGFDEHVQWLYVLEGQLLLTIGGRDVRAPQGSWLQMCSGLPRTAAPAGSDRVRYLDLRAPRGCEQVS